MDKTKMNFLLIVDVQNDFCSGGSLAVPNGDRIIPKINKLINSGEFDYVIATQDWHPQDHISFYQSDEKPFEFSERANQVVWPIHCVQSTEGAELRPTLDQSKINMIVRKGINKDVDSYSAFYDNDTNLTDEDLEHYNTNTGLADLFANWNDPKLYVCGIATDVCVKATVDHAMSYESLDTTVISDACAGVTDSGHEAALEEMKKMGAKLLETKDLV